MDSAYCVTVDSVRVGRREKDAFHPLSDVKHCSAHCQSLGREEFTLSTRGIQFVRRRTVTLGKQAFSLFEQNEKGNPVTMPREFVWWLPFILPRDLALELLKWLRFGYNGTWAGFCPRPPLPQGQLSIWDGFLLILLEKPVCLVWRGQFVSLLSSPLAVKDCFHMGLPWTSHNCLGHLTWGKRFRT